MYIYCTLCGRIKGTKCALFSIKCKGAVWKKKHSYEVNFFIVFAPQRIPEGGNCIFAYQHYTMNVHVRALSSMATIIYVFIEFNFLFYRVATSGKAFQHKA